MNRWLVHWALLASLTPARLSLAQQVPRLPEPSGISGVGRLAFDWRDAKRQDPFSTDRSARRELMVYVWYPTAPDQKIETGVYLPGARQIDAAAGSERITQSPIWSLIVSGAITSHARERAPVVRRPRRFPVVLFSHGDGVYSFAYTSAIEDLVSHGYIVAAVEHTYSAAAVVFPDGR